MSKHEIRGWLLRGKSAGYTHVLIVCDTFSREDYPVYVSKGKKVREVYEKYNGSTSTQRVVEVYALHLDLEAQLGECRAFHFEDHERKEPMSDTQLRDKVHGAIIDLCEALRVGPGITTDMRNKLIVLNQEAFELGYHSLHTLLLVLAGASADLLTPAYVYANTLEVASNVMVDPRERDIMKRAVAVLRGGGGS